MVENSDDVAPSVWQTHVGKPSELQGCAFEELCCTRELALIPVTRRALRHGRLRCKNRYKHIHMKLDVEMAAAWLHAEKAVVTFVAGGNFSECEW